MVKLTDDYYIDADYHCYSLRKLGINDNKDSKNYGQEEYDVIGYYSTIQSCLDGVVKTEIRKFLSKEDKNTLTELKEHIDKINKMLAQAIPEESKTKVANDAKLIKADTTTVKAKKTTTKTTKQAKK